jgi:phosphate transport system substrate-binding protein
MRIIGLAALGAALVLGLSKPQASDDQNPSRPLELLNAYAEGQAVRLHGAGATFPYPLYSKWITVYQKDHPAVRIDYRAVGSGAGIRQILAGAVDFGASDAPMTDDELAQAKGPILHLPMTLGAVVVAYNLPDLREKLRLTPEVIGSVFLGEITRWNDNQITGQNPGVPLPATEITVVHRADGSGTTGIFKEYLSTVVPRWKEKVGTGKGPNFPIGVGATGNEGVSARIKSTPGSVGYVELAYAIEIGLPYASLRNQAGAFVDPSPESITAAASTVRERIPDDMRTFLVNSPAANAYPLSGFSYVLIYRDQPNEPKGRALAEFLWWDAHEGQAFCTPLHYAKLPPEVVIRVEQQLRSASTNGRPLLP